MKGLLLKDWYMMKQYCRAYLLVTVLFLVISAVNSENLFMVFYPCLFCGLVPVSLLGYDERSRWLQYSATLPYSRAQIVSGKYLIGLLTQLAVFCVTGLVQGVRMKLQGGFDPGDFLVLMLLLLSIATVTSSISLPFMFKLGVEKGRIAYYVMVGFACAAGVLSSRLLGENGGAEITPNQLLGVAFAGILLYALSWYLSIVFYQKREL